ncbi:MAG: hypothetical protein PHD13_04655 [Methanocellales archaeon]|nr:hypothetical protein [Methanocellales archaeon]MDD3291271.1 hypothetical protein [Methanocellales archaeon]MDD5235443.1 hypothetical protein [Methanocellales archaeon]MDD5484474.1 hypothetical protein [Methanocellales archaeon]
MKFRIGLVLVLVLSVLTVTFSGCVGEELVMPSQPIAPRAEAAPTPTPKPTPIPIATPVPTQTQTQEVSQLKQIKFSGCESGITPVFQLESGTFIFRMKNDAPSNFTVLLVDVRAIEFCGCCYQYITAVPVDTIGPFDGVKTVEIFESGDYILDVKAEGQWSIIIEQP